MITFFLTPEHQYTLAYLKMKHPDFPFKILTYPRLFRMRELPAGTYIFSDLERLDQWELRVAAQIWQLIKNAETGFRVLNNPAIVKTRYSLLRDLYREGLNNFNVYRVEDRFRPEKFPVFVRREFDHSKPLTGLVQTQGELEQSLQKLISAGEPTNGLLITEYAAEPVAEKIYRKYGTFRVGRQVFPHCCVHDHQWLVKYGEFTASTKQMQKAEFAFVKNNRHNRAISKAFNIANIEFGRADFGIVDGRPQIYEINTNPTISFNVPDEQKDSKLKHDTLALSESRFLEALLALDTANRDADPVKLQSGRLQFLRKKRSYEQMRIYRH